MDYLPSPSAQVLGIPAAHVWPLEEVCGCGRLDQALQRGAFGDLIPVLVNMSPGRWIQPSGLPTSSSPSSSSHITAASSSEASIGATRNNTDGHQRLGSTSTDQPEGMSSMSTRLQSAAAAECLCPTDMTGCYSPFSRPPSFPRYLFLTVRLPYLPLAVLAHYSGDTALRVAAGAPEPWEAIARYWASPAGVAESSAAETVTVPSGASGRCPFSTAGAVGGGAGSPRDCGIPPRLLQASGREWWQCPLPPTPTVIREGRSRILPAQSGPLAYVSRCVVESVVAGEGPKQTLQRLHFSLPSPESCSPIQASADQQSLAALMASLTRDECSKMVTGFLGAFPGVAAHSVSLVQAATQGR